MKKTKKIRTGLELAAITGLAALVFSACGVYGSPLADGDSISEAVGSLIDDISEVTDEMKEGFSEAKDNIEKLTPQVKEQVGEMEDGFTQAKKDVKEVISDAEG